MRCKCCGEEVGNASVCPICGAKIEKEVKKPEQANSQPQTGSTTPSNANILKQLEEEKIKLIDECCKSVTKIIVRDGRSTSSGTGWVGAENIIITNAHVIGQPSSLASITCEFSDKLKLGAGQKIRLRLLYLSEDEDIAILRPMDGVISKKIPVLPIDPNDTKQGETVFTIGNPLHYKFTYTEGAVANPNYHCAHSGGRFNTLQTTLTLNCGNSGGPVFSTSGKVVGMATFSEVHEETETLISPRGNDEYIEQTALKEILGYGFCVKSEAILSALKQIR